MLSPTARNSYALRIVVATLLAIALVFSAQVAANANRLSGYKGCPSNFGWLQTNHTGLLSMGPPGSAKMWNFTSSGVNKRVAVDPAGNSKRNGGDWLAQSINQVHSAVPSCSNIG